MSAENMNYKDQRKGGVPMLFADVIIDISHENLDRTYQYRIPEELVADAVIGAPVEIPFGAGNRSVKGYLIGLSREPKIDINRIKPLKSIEKNGLVMESRMIALAARMKGVKAEPHLGLLEVDST